MIELFAMIMCGFNIGDYRATNTMYRGYKGYHVSGDQAEIAHLSTHFKDFGSRIITQRTSTGLQVLVSPKSLQRFKAVIEELNVNATLKYNDFQKELSKEPLGNLSKSGRYTFDKFYRYNDIYRYLVKLERAYFRHALVAKGGQTLEGRGIYGLKVYTDPLDNKPAIFIEGGIHPIERIVPAALTYFINELVSSDNENMTMLRETFAWYIFPVVNPDGYEYTFNRDRLWRKTLSRVSLCCLGVNMNRNFDYHFKESGEFCDKSYSGETAFSEIEARTLSEYISTVKNLKAYLAFHSFRRIIAVPFSDSTEHVDNYDDLVDIGKTSARYVYDADNSAIYKGPATAAEFGVPFSGNSIDWVRQTFGTPLVFEYQIGGDDFIVSPDEIAIQGEEVKQLILGIVSRATELEYF